MMRLGRWSVFALGVAVAACASTIGPLTPSVQVLVVLDSTDDVSTLLVIPVDSPDVVHHIHLDIGTFNRHALALRGQFAAIGAGGVAYGVDLVAKRTTCTATIGAAAPIAALAFHDDGNVYAAIPSTNATPHFDPTSTQTQCPIGGGFVLGGPTSFVSARGFLFVVVANSGTCQPAGCAPSWLAASLRALPTDSSPRATGDSIQLSQPGNAQGAVLAADGSLYVINAGNGGPTARLSQVDPVQRVEQNVYNGFGTLPKYIATDGERVFVASAADGLMVFNTRTKQVEHDFNSAIPLIGSPRGLAVDDVGRIYALIAGPCNTSGQGSVQIFGADLVNKHGVTVGHCPVAIGVTDIPAALYHFDN